MTPPVPSLPRPTPRRLQFAAHAAVLGLALTVPFANSELVAGTPPTQRPVAVLAGLAAGDHAVEDTSAETGSTAPRETRRQLAPRVRRLPQPLVARPARGPVSSPFGWRRHPVTGRTRHHDGADLAVPLGTVVRAVASGVVRSAGRRSGYGLVVEIEHAALRGHRRFRTLYAHLSSTDRGLRPGTRVAPGQPIAASGGVPGRDGVSTGPHLHFEVRDASGQALDPAPFLTASPARRRADEQRWQVMFSSGRKPPTARLDPRSGRRARAAFALPGPAGSRGRPRGVR